MALNTSLISVSPADDLSKKSLPASQSFCSLEAGNLVVSALKKAESGNALVLRVYDTEGSPAQTAISLVGQKRGFRELNLLEENTASADRDVLNVAPFEIQTIKLALEPRPVR